MEQKSYIIIDLTPENVAEYGVCGYKDVKKHLELRRKIDWFCKYYPLGLRIKAVIADTGEYQGMLEYIPGEYAHRPVNASGFLPTGSFSAFSKIRENLKESTSSKY